MKIGISTKALFPEKHTEEAALIIKSLGAECAEAFFSTFYEYRPEFAKALAPKIGGLEINSVHTVPLNFECNLFDTTRRVRGDGFYWLDQVARSAQLLGCKNYTLHGFPGMCVGRCEDIGFIGERVAEVHAFLARYGVSACLENTAHYAYNYPSFFRKVKEYCPQLYGVFDIRQARQSGYPYAMYIEDMAGAIGYAHISDVDENGNTCLPGRGVYDFAELFKRLAGAGFDGCALIEVSRGDFCGVDELKQSVEFLKEIAEKVK